MNRIRPAPVGYSVLILAFSSAFATSQVTARQGNQTVFQSPMILETTFPLADRSIWNKDEEHWFIPKGYSDLSRFRCDGVSISGLSLHVKPFDADRITVTFRTTLSNPAGHDKRVWVMFEVVNGEDVALSAAFPSVEVPEGKSKTRDSPIRVATKDLKSNPETRLRITVQTQDY